MTSPDPPQPRDLLLALRLKGRLVLCVGAGAVGLRRAARALEAGAEVALIDPRPEALAPWRAAHPEARCHARPFEEGDLDGASLVLACTDDPALNARIAALARARGIWCSSAHGDGDAAVLAGTRRGPLTVAISTDGQAPGAARTLRTHLDGALGPEWAALAALGARLRQDLQRLDLTPQERQRRLQRWHEGPVVAWLRQGALEALDGWTRQTLDLPLSWPQASPRGTPTVLLSGFGPFPGVPENPSPRAARDAAALLAAARPELRVEVAELPTAYGAAWELLKARIEALEADPAVALRAVLPLGVAASTPAVRIERIAVNHRASGRPDATGVVAARWGEPVVVGGPDGLLARMEVERIAAEVADEGHEVVTSASAGAYVCNDLMYHLLLWANRADYTGRAGFIHIPMPPSPMTGAQIAQAVAAIVTRAVPEAR